MRYPLSPRELELPARIELATPGPHPGVMSVSPREHGVSGRTRTDVDGVTTRCLSHSATPTMIGAPAGIRTRLCRLRGDCIPGNASGAWRARWDSNPRSGFPRQIKSLHPLPLGSLAHGYRVTESNRRLQLVRLGPCRWTNPALSVFHIHLRRRLGRDPRIRTEISVFPKHVLCR